MAGAPLGLIACTATLTVDCTPGTQRAQGVPQGFRADLPRWQHLISAAWLADWLDGRPVPAAPAGHWCLLEVGCDGLQDYVNGHIPGARYLDTHTLERLPYWNKVPDAQLQAVLCALGICADSCVLLYGRNPLAAARAAHLMLYAGVRDVRLLDAGMAAWQAAHMPLQAGHAPAPVSASSWGVPFPAHPELLIDLGTARTWAHVPGCALVSIRSQAEYLGLTSGYPYIPRAGEIPGALWGHAGKDGDVQDMQSFHTPEGRMRPAAEIAAMWAQAGIHPPLHMAFYCGTGWRASLAFFYAWLMGWNGICVFDGGWMEWSDHPELPVVCR